MVEKGLESQNKVRIFMDNQRLWHYYNLVIKTNMVLNVPE